MFFIRCRLHEALVEVVDNVRCPPVKLRCDGRHVGGKERRHQHSFETNGKMISHRVDVAEPFLGRREIWIQHEGSKTDDNPGPGPQAVVSDGEPEGGKEGVFLVLGGHHTLRNVTATPRLGARIPGGPPLDANESDKGRDGESERPTGRLRSSGFADHRSEAERPFRELRCQARDAPDFGQ